MNVNEQNTLKLKTLLFSVFLVLGMYNLNAQALVCDDQDGVALDPTNCQAVVTPGDIVVNQPDFPGFPAGFTVDLYYDAARTIPVPTSPTLTSAEIGLTIYVVVTHGPSGNFCDNAVISPISDNTIPNLTCPMTPTTVDCTDNLTPVEVPDNDNPMGFPVDLNTVTVIDNLDGTYTLQGFDPCGDATLSYVDDVTMGDCMTGPLETIVRTWTVDDGNGNTTSCTEDIIVNIADVNNIVYPTFSTVGV